MTQLPAAIQAIFEETRGELDRRVTTVEDAVSALLGGDLDEELRASATRDAHKLAGSLGMFGLPRGSEYARELEQALAPPEGPTFGDAPRLSQLVLDLRGQLDGTPSSPPPGSDPRHSASDGRALLIVSPDPELTERLSVEALGRNLRPRSATTPAGATRFVEVETPDAAVLDVTFGQGDSDALELLEALAGRNPPVPVLVLTASDALVDRVEVARRGGRRFLPRTRPAGQVIGAVSEQVERAGPGDAKVLTVDDDETISRAVTAVLEPHGLTVAVLNDPLRFWEILESAEPDLLVLDLDMPGLNGIDLCRAVRADRRFGQLPIVFLTVNTDPERVQEIFEAGADDYVNKPIVGPELVTRVLNRLDRVRLYRDLAETDGLTGVASRRRSSDAIERLLAAGERSGQPVSLALLDLDGFEDLNDRLGHAAGDDVLRRLAAVMGEAFGGDDVIGRWRDDKFAVGMYGMGRDDAVQRVAELLEAFRREWFSGRQGRRLRTSFSAGVAEHVRDGADLAELERAAETALRSAKAGGRDRVLPAGSEPDDDLRRPDVVVVEDDEVLARLLIASLETRGYRTRWLTDGQDAVTVLAGAAPEVSPALVLLDVDLPGLDGLSVLRRLADDDVLSRSRVILLTARSGEAEVVTALELGAFDHVAKPFSMPVLMQRVRGALRR